MSRAHRTYTITDRELRSIEREHERNERALRREMESALDHAINEAGWRIEEARNEMNRKLDRAVSSLSRDMDEMDRRHCQQIRNLSDSVYRDMARQQNELMYAINVSSAELHSRIDAVTASMEKQFREQQAQINSVNARVETLFQKIAKEESRMAEVVAATADLLKAVSERTPVSIYTPLQYSRVSRRVAELLSNTDPATSKIALAREISNSIWEMEEDAILAKAKHDAIYNVAVTRLSAVLKFVNENRTREVNPNDEDTYKIETDYWTRGKYSETEKRLNEMRVSLTADPDHKSEDEIKTIIQTVSELEQQCQSLIEQAVNRSLLSERRVEMTEDIVGSLLQQGWRLQYESGKEAFNYMGGEEDNDQREGVYAILKGPENQEITVIVSPDSQEMGNTISFHRNDEREMTEKEYLQSLAGIQNEIEHCGYQLGKGTCSAKEGEDHKIPEMSSSKKLSAKGAVKKIKEHTR